MRFLLFTCILLLTNISTYANIPAEIINTSILIEVKPTKNTQKELKKNKKQAKQLRKQNRKLKWQLLKNAIKAQKMSKVKNKKDKKPIYWASWASVLLTLGAQLLFGIVSSISGIFALASLIAVPVGILGLILAIKSIRFLRKNPKEINNTYNRTWTIIFTVLGVYFGIASIALIVMAIRFALVPSL